MMLTSPYSSSSEFWSGVAVSSSLRRSCQRVLERVGDHVRRLVDVPQPVRFVDHDQVPRRGRNVGGLAPRELVRADDDRMPSASNGLEVAVADRLVVRLRFEDPHGRKNFSVSS